MFKIYQQTSSSSNKQCVASLLFLLLFFFLLFSVPLPTQKKKKIFQLQLKFNMMNFPLFCGCLFYKVDKTITQFIQFTEGGKFKIIRGHNWRQQWFKDSPHILNIKLGINEHGPCNAFHHVPKSLSKKNASMI